MKTSAVEKSAVTARPAQLSAVSETPFTSLSALEVENFTWEKPEEFLEEDWMNILGQLKCRIHIRTMPFLSIDTTRYDGNTSTATCGDSS